MTNLSKNSLRFNIFKVFFSFEIMVKSFNRKFLITTKSINSMYDISKILVLQTISITNYNI